MAVTSEFSTKKETSMVRFQDDNIREKSRSQIYSHAYLPRLNREQTVIPPSTNLQDALQDLVSLLEDVEALDKVAFRADSLKVLELLVPALRQLTHLDIKKTFVVDYEPQFSTEKRTLYALLPFKYEGAKLCHLDHGYVKFQLPAVQTGKTDAFYLLRSYDGKNLSPMKFAEYFSEHVEAGLRKIIRDTEVKLRQGPKKRKKVSFAIKDDIPKDEGESSVPETIQEESKDQVTDSNLPSEEIMNSTDEQIDEDEIVDSTGSPEVITDETMGNPDDIDITDSKDISQKGGSENTSESPERENADMVVKDVARNDLDPKMVEAIDQEAQEEEHKIFKEALGDMLSLLTSITIDKNTPLCLKFETGWQIELIPAIMTSAKDHVYITKPYMADENTTSDLRWRICCCRRENQLIKSICCTDKDLRLTVVKLVSNLTSCDSRLKKLTEYDIQTCLLHQMDKELDTHPRWQRQSLEKCSKSLIKQILDFLTDGHLPHFFIPDFNLLEYWTPTEIEQAANSLERLYTSDSQLISLVNRANQTLVNSPNNYGIIG